MDQRSLEYERMRELLHTTQEVLHNERETKTLALTELASLRARIAAAVAECERIELAPGLSTVRGQRPTSPHVIAAQRIRAKLEGR